MMDILQQIQEFFSNIYEKLKSDKRITLVLASVALVVSIAVLYYSFRTPPKVESTVDEPKTQVYYIPTYNVVYNITDYIEPTIYRKHFKRFILILYDSSNLNFDVNFTYEYAQEYNITPLLYDIRKPWFGLELYENLTLPLVPLIPIPSVLCYIDGKGTILYGESLQDKQNIIMFIDSCAKNETSFS